MLKITNLNLEKIKITEIIPSEYNPRQISETEYQKLADSINEFGFVDPIIINLKNNHIIGGHQRYDVLLNTYIQDNTKYNELNIIQLGDIGWIFPDTDLTIKNDDYEKALNLVLNKISGEWDTDKLETIFNDLNLNDFDLDLTGFDNIDFEELDINIETLPLEPEDTLEEDHYKPEDEIQVTVKKGDYYQLGRHRLLCGDSTKKEDILKLVDNNRIDMIFTDPPYGMSAVSASGVLSEKYKNDIMNDDTNEVAIASFKLARKLYPDITHIWWGSNFYCNSEMQNECWIIWDKNNGASDQTDCELAYTNLRSAARMFTIASDKKGRVHPTQKPIKLYELIFNKFHNKGTFNNILDLFGGGGSTLIFAEQTGRTCYMMELDPYYCQVILNRYSELTGDEVIKLN